MCLAAPSLLKPRINPTRFNQILVVKRDGAKRATDRIRTGDILDHNQVL